MCPSICLQTSKKNDTGFFRCPLALMNSLFIKAKGRRSHIQFNSITNIHGRHTFFTPWQSKIYKSYHNLSGKGYIILVNFYSDKVTLARSETQNATFMRVSLSNIEGFSNFATIGSLLESHLPRNLFVPPVHDAQEQILKLDVYLRFIFLVFQKIIRVSYTGTVVDGHLLLSSAFMVIANQSEERTLPCLQRREPLMDCTSCTMPTRCISGRSTNIYSLSSLDEAPGDQQTIRHCMPILGDVQLSTVHYPARNVLGTMIQQLQMGIQYVQLSNSTTEARFCKRWLLENSAHDLTPALVAFAGLGSEPSHLYNVIGSDKLYVFELGLIKQYC